MKKLYFIIAIMLLQSAAFAQSNISTKIEASVQKKYPKAEEVDVYDNDADGFLADFYDNDILKTAFFDASGNWLRTEQGLTEEELPSGVQKTVNGKFKDAVYEQVSSVEAPSESYYSIQLSDADGDSHQLKVGTNGTLISAEKVVIADDYDDGDWDE